MKVIGLTGLPRSGKDTVGVYLADWHKFKRMSFAGPLKEAAAKLLNRPLCQMDGVNEDGSPFDREAVLPEWGFTTRHFLQWLGTEGMRRFDQEFWVKHLEIRLGEHSRGIAVPGGFKYPNSVVVTDVRFQNEVDMIRKYGGVIIEVRRPGTAKSGHASDQGVQLGSQDVVIENDGTLPQFYEKLHNLNRESYSPARRSSLFEGII